MSCSVVVVTPTFDYGKYLRDLHQADQPSSSGQATTTLSTSGSESSLSSLESQRSVSTTQTLKMSYPTSSETCVIVASGSTSSQQSPTTYTQVESPSTSTITPSPSETPHTQYHTKSRSKRSLDQILPPPNLSPSSSIPFHAPINSSTTLYGELVNTVSALSVAAQLVAGGVRCVCNKVKRKLSRSRTLKHAHDKKLTQTASEETHDIGLLMCKRCSRAKIEERQYSTQTV